MKKQTTVERNYIDASGIQTRVLVPEGTTDLSTGIPVSLDVSEVFSHMPPSFGTTRLSNSSAGPL